LQTGEYRGFVGQFSLWLRGQSAIWRWPLLVSLGLHVLMFWPRPLQENRFGVAARRAGDVVQARLSPAVPALPDVPVKSSPVRQASATASSAGALRERPGPGTRPEMPMSAASSGLPPTPSIGLDAAAVRSYRIGWARALANSRLRDKLGADMHGALEVGVALTPAGQVREIALLKSSGIAALDHAVMAEMRNAVHAVQLPSAMRGRDLVIALPVEVGAAPPILAADR
jgi:TonB family protein